MKSMKIAKLLGIAIIISLLMVAIPTSPALGSSLFLNQTSGQIGDTITVTGSAFSPTTNPPDGVFLYFSSQPATLTQIIGSDITKYSTVASGITTGLTGTFTTTFTVPERLTSDNSAVAPGTHYLYACQPATSQVIYAIVSFTVVGGDISVSPLTGIVDSPLVITGTSFAASQLITIQFDGTTVIIEEGNTSTNTSGNFASTILIPESKAGLHDITATVGGYSASAQCTVEPDIIIFPQSGEVGDSVSISGTGFARRPKLVDIYFNNNFIQSAQTDTLGSFYIPAFEIPDLGLTQGSYYIEAEDEDANLAAASFTLNAISPTTTPPTTTPPTTSPDETDLSINTSGDTIGSLIGIGGAGFTPNGTAVLKYDGVEVATTTIESNGSFLVTFQAPPSAGGPHIITVTDGIHTAETTYTVETTPPSTPPPLLPRLGAKVNSPIRFDWEDVTDDSSPVKYALQISTDSSFSATSIVLEKTGLEVSEYTLTQQEELALAGKETPYYWRIKAIDAASNESAWSGPSEFYVSPPFSFPTWAIIVLSILGALIFFGVGYWLGRRTAFFY